MITLRQISNITGYSISTVSKALNNGMDVSIETKKYIQKIALQKNYIPNKAAISLRKNRSNTIAVILPQVNKLVFSEILFEIQKLAAIYDFRIVLFQSLNNSYNEKKYLKEINDGSFDGAIVVSTKFDNDDISSNIPTTLIETAKLNVLKDLETQCTIIFKKLLKQII